MGGTDAYFGLWNPAPYSCAITGTTTNTCDGSKHQWMREGTPLKTDVVPSPKGMIMYPGITNFATKIDLLGNIYSIAPSTSLHFICEFNCAEADANCKKVLPRLREMFSWLDFHF